ncbi:uncharacterized protein LOC122027405 [Zingiber officinale]|uniref:uncharacterized protein LOC122027405 n=1 Tax=Zingiber officinale TaxID=94328 RepID=UPI001C4DD85E|nr:uncharacterized protein LOC122027405 [Zingiber officinale]
MIHTLTWQTETNPSQLPLSIYRLSTLHSSIRQEDSATLPRPFCLSSMALTSAVTMSKPAISFSRPFTGSETFFQPLMLPAHTAAGRRPGAQLKVRALSSSEKEKALGGLAAAAMVAALVIPEVAEAAQPGISPSLKNFLLSIVSGGVVVGVIAGAVVAVSNFDPVKRS